MILYHVPYMGEKIVFSINQDGNDLEPLPDVSLSSKPISLKLKFIMERSLNMVMKYPGIIPKQKRLMPEIRTHYGKMQLILSSMR